jgi:hypothetical protein
MKKLRDERQTERERERERERDGIPYKRWQLCCQVSNN